MGLNSYCLRAYCSEHGTLKGWEIEGFNEMLTIVYIIILFVKSNCHLLEEGGGGGG